MKCMKCNNPTSIVDTRSDGDVIRRRRICTSCLARITTVEKVEELGNTPMQKVGKKQETRKR